MVNCMTIGFEINNIFKKTSFSMQKWQKKQKTKNNNNKKQATAADLKAHRLVFLCFVK